LGKEAFISFGQRKGVMVLSRQERGRGGEKKSPYLYTLEGDPSFPPQAGKKGKKRKCGGIFPLHPRRRRGKEKLVKIFSPSSPPGELVHRSGKGKGEGYPAGRGNPKKRKRKKKRTAIKRASRRSFAATGKKRLTSPAP